MRHIAVTVNGTRHEADVEPRTLLVYFIRETVGLTGTNVGCDTSTCGACTVQVEGQSVKSCTMLAVQADGRDIKTIEAWHRRNHAPATGCLPRASRPACGYCTWVITRVLLIPVLAALGYEVLRWGAKHRANPIVKAVMAASETANA